VGVDIGQFRVLPDDGDTLARGDVVAGRPIVVGFDIEAFGEELFVAGKAIASAHDEEEYS
jgi:hypothetical protein